MGLLQQVRRGRVIAPRRVLLYGVEGIGKSSFGAQAPGAVFLPTETGLDDIDCASMPLVTSWEMAMESLRELYMETHEFKTLVVDSVDWLEALVWQAACEKKGVSNIEAFGYGKGYIEALEYWRLFIQALSALRDDKGMGVVLLAHSKIEPFRNPEGEDYDRYMPRLHKLASSVLREWCDEVLFASYKTFVKQADSGGGMKTAAKKPVGGDLRVLKTTEKPAHMAKNRLDMPDEIPFTKGAAWAEYAKFFRS